MPLITSTLTNPSSIRPLPVTSDGRPFRPDRALQDIAESGKHWRERYVRKGDMEVSTAPTFSIDVSSTLLMSIFQCYVYRLMIEWAAMLTAVE
jgi:hypothetical protein